MNQPRIFSPLPRLQLALPPPIRSPMVLGTLGKDAGASSWKEARRKGGGAGEGEVFSGWACCISSFGLQERPGNALQGAQTENVGFFSASPYFYGGGGGLRDKLKVSLCCLNHLLQSRPEAATSPINRVARVAAPSLEVFKKRLDNHLSGMV